MLQATGGFQVTISLRASKQANYQSVSILLQKEMISCYSYYNKLRTRVQNGYKLKLND